MTVIIGRRELLAAVGGAAAAWPLAARAQQAQGMPVIGFLEATTAADSVYRVSAFRDGLKEAGFIDESSRAPPAFGWRARQKRSRPVLEAG
jgi:putative ABC transport system substrate-binding protein